METTKERKIQFIVFTIVAILVNCILIPIIISLLLSKIIP